MIKGPEDRLAMTAKVSTGLKRTSANIMCASFVSIFFYFFKVRHSAASHRHTKRASPRTSDLLFPAAGEGRGCLHTKGGPINGAEGVGCLRHRWSQGAITYACHRRGKQRAASCIWPVRQRDWWHKQRADSHAHAGFKAVNTEGTWSESLGAMNGKEERLANCRFYSVWLERASNRL